MNQHNFTHTHAGGLRQPPSGQRPKIGTGTLLMLVAAAGLLLWLIFSHFAPGAPHPIPTPVGEVPGEETAGNNSQQAAEGEGSSQQGAQTGSADPVQSLKQPVVPASPAITDTPASADPPPSPERARDLMTQLAEWGKLPAGITLEQAPAIKKQLGQLARQGPAALPAIREFLAQHVDMPFGSPEVARTVGAPTLRQGLLDILQGIPDPETVEIAAESLKKSPYPEEIAKLMSILEKQAPGVYRQEGIEAARQCLALAAEGQLTGQKVSPAFEILQTYGDASVIPDLQNALQTKWRQNAALALAELPDGIGIPVLVQLANDPAAAAYGRGDLLLRPLAQVSLRYQAAFDALLQQAQQNNIPETAWPTVISALAGKDYISNGQVLPDTRQPSIDLNQIVASRIALLDRLAPVVSSPAGKQLLAEQRAFLVARIQPPSKR